MPGLDKVAILARMVKIEHSVFALPFAYLGAFLVAGGWPGWQPLLLLTVAMVAVRSFAMAFNRLADVRYDSLNPRTQSRPLVSGEIGKKETWLFVGVCALVFVGCCALMNPVCLLLSPFALAISAFYSFVKRFSWLCHFVLGLVLALAPVAGWLSVQPGFAISLALFFLGVLFWVAGFDIIYSCQDVEFDVTNGLHSLPAAYGMASALHISFFCHVNTSLFFFAGRLGCRAYLALLPGLGAGQPGSAAGTQNHQRGRYEPRKPRLLHLQRGDLHSGFCRSLSRALVLTALLILLPADSGPF